MTDEETRKPRPTPHLKTPAFREAAYCFTAYAATVESGVTLEDCKNPEFWMHVADRLRPSDEISVYAADQTFYAKLLVLSTNRVSARVAVIAFVDLTTETQDEGLGPELAKYDISWAGPSYKWRVVHKASKEVIKDGFDNEAAARTFLITVHLPQKPKMPGDDVASRLAQRASEAA